MIFDRTGHTRRILHGASYMEQPGMQRIVHPGRILPPDPLKMAAHHLFTKADDDVHDDALDGSTRLPWTCPSYARLPME